MTHGNRVYVARPRCEICDEPSRTRICFECDFRVMLIEEGVCLECNEAALNSVGICMECGWPLVVVTEP